MKPVVHKGLGPVIFLNTSFIVSLSTLTWLSYSLFPCEQFSSSLFIRSFCLILSSNCLITFRTNTIKQRQYKIYSDLHHVFIFEFPRSVQVPLQRHTITLAEYFTVSPLYSYYNLVASQRGSAPTTPPAGRGDALAPRVVNRLDTAGSQVLHWPQHPDDPLESPAGEGESSHGLGEGGVCRTRGLLCQVCLTHCFGWLIVFLYNDLALTVVIQLYLYQHDDHFTKIMSSYMENLSLLF